MNLNGRSRHGHHTYDRRLVCPKHKQPCFRYVQRNLQPREGWDVINRGDFLAGERVDFKQLLLAGFGSRLSGAKGEGM
jgi:hypothetical protein